MVDIPLVSVIMSVYNNESTVKKCIDSLINQTYSNWELIVCDDNSTDNSKIILEALSSKDTRIRLICNNVNNGLASSLNRCLRKSRGKYIARMDADDINLEDRLKNQVEYLEKHPDCDIVGSSMFVKNEKGIIGIRTNSDVLNRDSFLHGSPFFHPTVMVKRSVMNSLHGYNTKVYRSEDLDLWFRLYQEGYKGVNFKKPLYIYQETLNDLKKRNIKGAVTATLIFLEGYSNIGVPFFKRWHAFKPIISSILPDRILNNYHKQLMKKRGN